MTHSFDGEYWNDVWNDDRGSSMSTAPPNPHLVREVGDLPPGSALDAGCGAGAEAIWLATRGWQVTAVDIAPAALAQAAERASADGVDHQITWVRADLSAWHAGTEYDLVTTHYAHPTIPQLEFYSRVASWVAPGGTLLIVGHLRERHDHHHDHDHGDDHDHGRGERQDEGPPSSASTTAADVVAVLDPAEWEVTTAQELRRTMSGPAGQEIGIDDVVVRATRRRTAPATSMG